METELVKEWLKSKQTSLWGESFMVVADDSLEKAAAWFKKQMDDFNSWELDRVQKWVDDVGMWHAGALTDSRAWDVVQ